MQHNQRSINFLISLNSIFDIQSITYSYINHLHFFAKHHKNCLNINYNTESENANLEKLIKNISNEPLYSKVISEIPKRSVLENLRNKLEEHNNEIRPFIGSIRVLNFLNEVQYKTNQEVTIEFMMFADEWWNKILGSKLKSKDQVVLYYVELL